ncbi:MAG: hypothetical protein JW965_06025 [Bacteroidales bacterium]|nr:hypothetical protein [Bacteroidales bacterium]
MKILLKIFKYFALISITFILILYILSLIFEREISGLFVKELNKNLNTTIQISELNFSLLRRFPRASIELNDIYIKSPDTEGENSSYGYPDTLLFAGKMVLTLKITELIQKNYSIDRIDIDRGKINICKGSTGKLNTSVLKTATRADTSAINLNINNININNSSFSYGNPATGFLINGEINNSSNKLTISEKYTDLKTKTGMILSDLKTSSEYFLSGTYPIRINTGIKISKDSILIARSSIDINNIKFEGDGIIEKPTHQLSLTLETYNTSIISAAEILPVGFNNFMHNYGITGQISGSIDVKGKYDKSSPMLLIASLDINQGSMKIPSIDIEIDDISTKADLKMDLNNSNRTFIIRADSFTAQTGGTGISGSFQVRNLINPDIDIIATGFFQSSRIAEMINIEGLQSSEGTIRLNARLRGAVPSKSKAHDQGIHGLHYSINMGLNDINLRIPGFESDIKDIHGNIMIADNIWFDDLSMSLNDHNIALRGMISGFNRWLSKEDDLLDVTAGLWSDKIDINAFRETFTGQKSTASKRDTRLKLKLSLIGDSITIGNFRASLFEGNISYMPGSMDITSFSMNSLGGLLSGNAVVSGFGDNVYAIRGRFDIVNVDIKNAFTVFNDFRQDYIKSENLEGNITGNVSMSARADTNFKISKEDLVLNGEYSILNGKLVDFEPAYKLSRFIDMEELERIDFSKLENELIINNEMITIPWMDISSSAFNISLEGNHAFSGNYEYHVKVLLSELLSKKKNLMVTEYGVIEDDGLGRTSLYLRINGDKNGSMVSHDSEALRAGIKEDLIREKQTIKSILQEEYGLYAGDSMPVTKTKEARRFRIVWEETDSIKTEIGESGEKKLPLIRLFKKKDIKKEQPEKE